MLFFIVPSLSADHLLVIRCSITIPVSLSALEITSRVSLPLLFKRSWHSGGRRLGPTWLHSLMGCCETSQVLAEPTAYPEMASRKPTDEILPGNFLLLLHSKTLKYAEDHLVHSFFWFTPCISPMDLRATLWHKHFVLLLQYSVTNTSSLITCLSQSFTDHSSNSSLFLQKIALKSSHREILASWSNAN